MVRFVFEIGAAASAALLFISCSESVQHIADRVFSLAQEQVLMMDARLSPASTPRTFENGIATDVGVTSWTSGFFPGSAWYVFEYTGNRDVLEVARRRTMELSGLPSLNVGHDIGFMINSSFGNALRITGDSKYAQVMKAGAENLASRFNPVVGCTSSWDKFRDSQFTVIIDNMMNLELLTRVARMVESDSLMDKAIRHARTTMNNHFHPDFTSWHVVSYDPQTGSPVFKCTAQGLSDDSAWARGQAWALYGYTMMFRETGIGDFLHHAEKIAGMLLTRLPGDGIPYWDFNDPDIPSAPRDASAGAVMASAFAELSGLTCDRRLSRKCRAMSLKQVRTLASNQYLASVDNGNFLLRHSVGNKPGGIEIDVPLVYADYYFLEAILRLSRNNRSNPQVLWTSGIDHPLWRGERCGLVASVSSNEGISGLKAEITGVPFAKANFLTYVMGDNLSEQYNQCGWRRNKKEWDSLLVADRIGNEISVNVAPDTHQFIWISVKVPYDCKPGHYEGTLKLRSRGSKTIRLPFSFEVSDRSLPAVHDFTFHLDLWQNPYSVARYHGVEPWSEEHFKHLGPVMKLLADAGQKVVTTTIIDRPWDGQTEDAFGSMIEKKRHADGSWTYDYSIFDHWVEFMESIGIDSQINCYSMIPWKLTFDYVDAESGQTRFVTAPADSPEYKDYWQHFLRDFSAHLKDKGWFDKTCIAMDERPMEIMKECLSVVREAVPDFKIALAGSYLEEIQDEIHDLCVTSREPYPDEIIEERRAKGMVSTYYTCCAEKYPNTFIVSNPNEGIWMGWYALAGNFDGYLRWAYNSWTRDPVKDARYIHWPAGDCYMVYPDGCSSVRFERLAEGVQDYEKASILRREWKEAGDTLRLNRLEAALDLFTIPRLGDEGPEHAISEARKALH
ncbi:MAG: DUF4091 domain-containing protein [Bacteroidales bacterium]|nr:DUF4091 domain-containing protein [Bacteroidales bacterium]